MIFRQVIDLFFSLLWFAIVMLLLRNIILVTKETIEKNLNLEIYVPRLLN